MPTATIVLVVALGLLMVVLLGTAIVLARSLARTGKALTVLGRRLEQAEQHLRGLRAEVAEIAGDVTDVAATAGRQARDLEDPTTGPAADANRVGDNDEVGSRHG